MFEKIKLTDDEGNELEVSVIEQTKINNTSYLLVTDSEEDEEGNQCIYRKRFIFP